METILDYPVDPMKLQGSSKVEVAIRNKKSREMATHASQHGCCQSLEAINAGEGVENSTPSCTVCGDATCQPLWRTVRTFLKN